MPFRRRRRAVQEQERTVERQPKQEEQLDSSQVELLSIAPALVRSPRLDLPANVVPRAALLRAQQQALGNRAVQRMLDRPATGSLAAELEEDEEKKGQLAGTVPAAVGALQEGEIELEDEYGGKSGGHMLGQPVSFGPGPCSWAALARQGLARALPEAPVPRQEDGVARGAAIGRVQYGHTEWVARNATFPKVEIEYTAAEESGKFTGKVKTTTSAMGPVTMWSLPAGEHVVAGSSVRADFPQCGAGGKQVPFSTMISPEMAGIAAQAEQEHKNDYTRTYTLTLVKWAGIINGVAPQTFGPDAKDKVKQAIDAELTSRGSKTRDQWVTEINRLNALSLQRDTPPGAAAHTLKSDGEPVTCPPDCSKVVATTVRAPTTNVPGVSSESLIN